MGLLLSVYDAPRHEMRLTESSGVDVTNMAEAQLLCAQLISLDRSRHKIGICAVQLLVKKPESRLLSDSSGAKHAEKLDIKIICRQEQAPWNKNK